jgi:hypothetical protein
MASQNTARSSGPTSAYTEPDDPPETAFTKAYNSFYGSLSVEEKILFAPCASSEDLIQALKKVDGLGKRRQATRFSRVTKAIEKVKKSLDPFLSVVNIMVQSNPEYASLVWGGFRFILEVSDVGSMRNSTLTKYLTEMTDKM